MKCVYLITNMVNDKVYVGQTKNFAVRKAGHLYAARKGSLRPLYAAIRKHGVESFTFEVIEDCIDEIIDERECHWVSHYNSNDPEKGYNLTRGGSGEQTFCEDVIAQRRETGRKCMAHLHETICADPAFRKRSSERMKRLLQEGRVKAPTWTGRLHRPETKEKIGSAMRIAQAGERNSQSGKVWISNHALKISKRVPRPELQEWLVQGWVLGRRMRWR